jgi:hypothetical protein
MSSSLAVLEPASSAAAYLNGWANLLVHATVFFLHSCDKLTFSLFVCVFQASTGVDAPIIVLRFVAAATGQNVHISRHFPFEQMVDVFA